MSNKNENIKYYLKISLTLLVISAVTATLLAFVNALTKDRIAQNEIGAMQDALSGIFGGCDEVKEIEGEYLSPVTAVYEVYSDGEFQGYGIKVEPVGFKDNIGIIVGADTDGICLGAEITSISDTPGVGTKVKEKTFLSGFNGLNGDKAAEYDTISGATISSKAVREGIAAALKLDLFIKDGAKKS